MSLQVLKPGALSQLQDLGRHGWQRFGVVVGGAMDAWSHRCANLLLGHGDDAATLEITLLGPSLRLTQPLVVALCGADLSAHIGGVPIPLNRALVVRAGAQLDFGPRIAGVRAYLAVRGGFAVPPVMGSRSTYARAGIGGLHGRALQKGDVLPVTKAAAPTAAELAWLGRRDFCPLQPGKVAPVLAPRERLRIVCGQQWDWFTEAARAAFIESEYRISPQSDRMGIRLSGPVLQRREPFEMISEAVAFGTVQVPPDGQPIVLMADRQTTGGYPKIASIASVDLPLLAQCMPGDGLRFTPIALEEAQQLYLARERSLAQLRVQLAP